MSAIAKGKKPSIQVQQLAIQLVNGWRLAGIMPGQKKLEMPPRTAPSRFGESTVSKLAPSMARLCFPAAFGAINAAVLVTAAFLLSGCVTDRAVPSRRKVATVASQYPARWPVSATASRRAAPETIPGPVTPAMSRMMAIAWDWPWERSNIVWNVYSTTNLAEPFRFRVTVQATQFDFVADRPQEFFEVTASNIVDGTESTPATR